MDVRRVDVVDRSRKNIGTVGSAGKPGGGAVWKVVLFDWGEEVYRGSDWEEEGVGGVDMEI
jgi:hypothetical protein